MEMKAVFIVACLYLVHFISDSNGEMSDRDYLIVIPRVLRGGTTANIGINIFGNISCDVELKLYGRKNRDVVSRAKGNFQPNEEGQLELKVPKIHVSRVGATVCGIETSRRQITYQVLPAKIFIQTDKPIYKPGQKVRIRILHVDHELKPAGSKISSVVIQEPSGSKIMQWSDVKLDDGMAKLDLQLSKDPVPGKWKIRATIEEKTALKQIEIDKYVLPKFQLEIKPPPYFAHDQVEIPVSICARYTYGKDVTGLLETTFCVKNKWSWDRSSDAYNCVKEVKNITGCEEFDARELLKSKNRIFSETFSWGWSRYFIHIKAIFTETSTGIKRENEASSPTLEEHSKTMSFFGLSEKFKPGFPFKFKIKVTYLDGKPVTDGSVRLEVSRTRFYYRGSRSLLEKTYPVKSGLISVVIEDMPHDTEKLHFKAIYDQTNMGKYGTSRAWYSPSLSYLQLIKSEQSTGKVGGQGSVTVLYTVRDGTTNYNFHHKIMCKGNLVQSGVTKENLTSDGNLESYSTPPPITTAFPLHPFENMLEPTVQEFEIKFNVTQDMVPGCRILVYYIRPDAETVGDSILYDIEDKLENQVSVNFEENQKRPGERTTIVMKAKPGSRVAISALDKSVLLLRNANEVKKSEVLGILNGQDVGPVQGYKGNCYSSFKPHVADASEAFNLAGVVFLSNLKVFTQPCYDGQQWFYEGSGRPVTTVPTTFSATHTDYWWGEKTGAFTNAPSLLYTDEPFRTFSTAGPSFGRIPTTTTLPVRKQKPIKKVKIRKDFPETWLWTDVKLNDTSGVQTMEVQVPDTITSWVLNGFAMSSVYGMAISDRATLKAFQPFFVQMTLPYSVIRGEEIPVTVTVFNYLSSCVPIKLELNREYREYRVTSFSITKMCVCGDDGKSVKFKIIPKRLGHIPLTVKALTSEAKLCPSSTVYAADAVTRKLLVEPEGIKQDYTRGTFFCSQKGKYNETIDLALPKDIIPGSLLPKISVVGDVMGPALSNLDGLLAMPYGCGEQNMAKFAPNIYIMDYLTNTDQTTQKIKDDAIHYMNSGYQRQLRYKRSRGSYSAFGNSDRQGSMMLTAFVVRSFARARKYIFIDQDEIEHSFNWFKQKQNANSGCFPRYGQLFDRSLQGGVNSELTITAYVTIALLEAGQQVQTKMVSKALNCITSKLDDIEDSYTTSLVTYALVLANHSKSAVMMNRLKKKATTSKGGQLFWSAAEAEPEPNNNYFDYKYYQRPPADVEMTAYALMSYIKRKESIEHVLKIVKWLSKQRNNYGGFSSTQDTCVALQALSEVAQKFYGTSTNLRISLDIGGIFAHNFQLADDNKLVLQRAEIPSNALPGKLNVVASGSGCALVQSSVKYNIPIPEETPAFDVEVSVDRREATDEEEITACYPLQLKITAKWLKKGVSNMAIVDVKLVSGFSVNEELLEQKLENANDAGQTGDTILKRYEIEGQNVILYFDEIKTMSFSLDILQSTLVKKTKPGVVHVYDYYEPESQRKVMYNITEEDCYGEKIEKECPKCFIIDDFEDFFDKNINCSVYLMRAKTINGQMKVRKAYIKTSKDENNKIRSYEIPEFCPCDEVYEGVKSLVLGPSDYFRKNGDETSIVFNAATTIARWNAKRMKKIFREKMMSKIYRGCRQLRG